MTEGDDTNILWIRSYCCIQRRQFLPDTEVAALSVSRIPIWLPVFLSIIPISKEMFNLLLWLWHYLLFGILRPSNRVKRCNAIVHCVCIHIYIYMYVINNIMYVRLETSHGLLVQVVISWRPGCLLRASSSGRSRMYGFLNMFSGTVFCHRG